VSALVELRDVRVSFRVAGRLTSIIEGIPQAIEAVAGVSLQVEEGETLAIVGESGSGKTTLARAMCGLVPVAAGSIRIAGREVVGLGDRELKSVRRQMAMMFQDPVGSLSPRMPVRSLLAEPFRVHGLGGRDLRPQIERLLKLVGLPPEFADRYPHQLSGGQARRIGVARALALEPALIVADEPTAGLDVSIQGEVLNLLNDLQERLGLTILIITHNLNVVRHIANRMAIMYLGRIVEEGGTDAIFETPRHPYTEALLSANPEPDPDAEHRRIELQGEVPSLFRRPEGCEFHTRCPYVRERCRETIPQVTEEGERRYLCHYPRGIAPDRG
jgi:oligopeptide/dipeptide ABC transporter ATP-binding protein